MAITRVKKIELPFATFGKWEVMLDGTIKSKYTNPSGKESTIHIYPESLSDSDIILEMTAGKIDSELGDAMQALFTACRLTGIKCIPNFLVDFE